MEIPKVVKIKIIVRIVKGSKSQSEIITWIVDFIFYKNMCVCIYICTHTLIEFYFN